MRRKVHALVERIAQSGAVSVAEFMAAALGDPEFGYYRVQEPFGAAGDFVTAPEISQMFGELVALWCLDLFTQLGEPPRLRLVELGPGRGTLMADLWRAAQIRPAFRAAARLHLVETSPLLRRRQAEALAGVAAHWHEDFAGCARTDAEAPLIVIANEFFDALPVHQLVRADEGWRERTVAFDAAEERLVFSVSESESELAALVPAGLGDAPRGSLFEISAAGRNLMAEIAGHIESARGGTLIIDYGHAQSGLGDTLQSVRAHRRHDVLSDPGSADITAHVDFGALGAIARERGAQVFGPVAQGDFLRRLGIETRARALLAQATPSQARDIAASLARLVDPAGMGMLFKAMAVTSAGLVPAGFAPPCGPA